MVERLSVFSIEKSIIDKILVVRLDGGVAWDKE